MIREIVHYLVGIGLHADVTENRFRTSYLLATILTQDWGNVRLYIDKGVGLLSVPEYGRGRGMSLTLSD